MSNTPAANRRLRSHNDFSAVYRTRQSIRNRNLTLCFVESTCTYSRLGLSVSKRIGNAVHRNRAKRILREVFRAQCHRLPANVDIVLIPRSYGTACDLEEMTESFLHLVHKLQRRLDDEKTP